MSKLEERIASILQKEQILFIREKSFKDLHGGLYRFDFYCPAIHAAIEAHGMQHYLFTKTFYKKRSDFTKAQERDRRKISYCLAHGITLYCIPYWDMEKLFNKVDIFKDSYIAHSKYHNDEIWRQKSRAK